MFKKNKSKVHEYHIIDGPVLTMSDEARSYIYELKNKIDDLQRENKKLKSELECIKPIIETKQLVPAVSAHCKSCRFVVKSRWNGEILGCRKDAVCDSFVPEDLP